MIRAVLTDIEGTTSSLSFVKDVLFPYSRAHLPDFIRDHENETGVRQLLNDARALAGNNPDTSTLIQILIQWIDEDRKATPLKALQGMIWEAGYQRGDFKGHVYKDANQALRTWHKRGIRLYVFSSGSVKAQQLLFRYTDYGDMTTLFNGYFDTTIGAKKESTSYQRIAEKIGLIPAEILFLSDIKEELDAAREACMHTRWLMRAPQSPITSAHPIVHNFSEINF